MKIGLVMVNYGTAFEALNAIKSAKEHLGENLSRIVVVENGTGEGNLFKDCGADIIEYEVNRGFAAGVNGGTRHLYEKDSELEAVLLLNPDTELKPGNWTKWLEQVTGRVVSMGPRIESEDGKQQASVYSEFSEAKSLLEAAGVHSFLERFGVRRSVKPERQEVPAMQGSCLLVTHKAWDRIGPFDEGFFLYHEEVDWCYRARQVGFVNLFNPEVTVMHRKGTTIPEGRDGYYWRGVIRLVAKLKGASEAEDFRSNLQIAFQARALGSPTLSKTRRYRQLAKDIAESAIDPQYPTASDS